MEVFSKSWEPHACKKRGPFSFDRKKKTSISCSSKIVIQKDNSAWTSYEVERKQNNWDSMFCKKLRVKNLGKIVAQFLEIECTSCESYWIALHFYNVQYESFLYRLGSECFSILRRTICAVWDSTDYDTSMTVINIVPVQEPQHFGSAALFSCIHSLLLYQFLS